MPIQSSGEWLDVLKFVGIVVGLAIPMYWSWNFVGPSGQTTDVVHFIGLWFRELLLLAICGLALIVGLFVWLVRQIWNLLVRS